MTAFLLCKSEAEHSATGPERERDKRGKSGRAREKNVGLPEAYHLDAPNPQLQTKKSSQC